MDAGQLVTMQIFSFFVFGPLQEIGNILLSYREAEASLNNFHNLMQKAPELEPAHPKPLGNIRTLAFKNVSFQHQTAAQKAINNFSFDVRVGETIAFVGPSGSGKTTLMKLLVGLYRPQEGKILYNNLDETELRFDDLRNQIGFVTQDTNLFSGPPGSPTPEASAPSRVREPAAFRETSVRTSRTSVPRNPEQRWRPRFAKHPCGYRAHRCRGTRRSDVQRVSRNAMPALEAMGTGVVGVKRRSVAGRERLRALEQQDRAVEGQGALARLGAQHLEADLLVGVPLADGGRLAERRVERRAIGCRLADLDHRGAAASHLDVGVGRAHDDHLGVAHGAGETLSGP